MRKIFNGVSAFSPRKTVRAAIAAAFWAAVAIQPAAAQVNHNDNTIMTPQVKAPCPPADAKKAAALRERIARDKERIEDLKGKIAYRKQQMEKIQPGSSLRSYADLASNSQLRQLALYNEDDYGHIAKWSSDVREDTESLGEFACQ